MKLEEQIMQLILHSGDARSKMINAVRESNKGNFEEAERLFEEGQKSLNLAHIMQTELIQSEIKGEKIEITLLLIHAQDHLMNAITVMDLVREIINMNKKQACTD